MFLIVGLGNPGSEYQKTRHNIGFRVIEKFKEENGFPDFVFSKKNKSLVSKGALDQEQVCLAMPQTLMNNSGQAVQSLVKYTDINLESLIVVHDDLDLEIAKIKISKDRGPAGHKGVSSIIKAIGHQNFIRLRIGIKAGIKQERDKEKKDFVLSNFSRREGVILKKVIPHSSLALRLIIQEGLPAAMNQINQ